jgi:hypothetical protein
MALGALVWFFPKLVGGGESLVEALIHQPMAWLALAALLTLRLLTTVGSYGLGLPGGIFAPLLALGTVVGAVVDALVQGLDPGAALSPGLFAVAAMGALFAATVRAPLTGIILAVELTGAGDLILPVIMTCLTATFAAEALGGRPIYSLLLEESDGAAASRRPSGRQLAVAGTLVTALLLAAPLARLMPPESRPPAVPHPVTADADLPARVASATVQEPAEVTAESDRPPPEPAKVTTAEPAPAVAPEQVQPPALANAPSTTEQDGLAEAAPGSPEPRLEKPVDTLVPPTPDSASIQASATSPAWPRYAIQLASFRQRATVAVAARRDGLLEQSSTLEPVRGWYPLLLGDYGTRAEAEAALEDLPERLRRQGPIIRELGPETRPLPLP